MKTKVIVEMQVLAFIRRQPPLVRQRLRETLRAIENGEIFPEPLEDELDGFYKVKIDRVRIILQHDTSASGPMLKAVFAENRKVVYQLFSQILGME